MGGDIDSRMHTFIRLSVALLVYQLGDGLIARDMAQAEQQSEPRVASDQGLPLAAVPPQQDSLSLLLRYRETIPKANLRLVYICMVSPKEGSEPPAAPGSSQSDLLQRCFDLLRRFQFTGNLKENDRGCTIHFNAVPGSFDGMGNNLIKDGCLFTITTRLEEETVNALVRDALNHMAQLLREPRERFPFLLMRAVGCV